MFSPPAGDKEAHVGDGCDQFQDNDSDYEMPVAVAKGKEKESSLEHHSLSAERLQEAIDDEIRRVASISGLEVPYSHACVLHFDNACSFLHHIVPSYLNANMIVANCVHIASTFPLE